MRALPTPDHPAPTASEAYFIGLEEALQNRPDLIDGLAPETRQALQNGLALHTDMIQHELDREAMALESRILASVAAKAAGVLSTLSPEARAGGAALRLAAAAGQRREAARMVRLRRLALGPRRLLLNLREALVRLP